MSNGIYPFGARYDAWKLNKPDEPEMLPCVCGHEADEHLVLDDFDRPVFSVCQVADCDCDCGYVAMTDDDGSIYDWE